MNNAGTNIIFRDVLLNALGAVIILYIMSVLFVNPPTNEDQGKTAPPGNLIAAITWPAGNTDVDLWVDAPGEPVPIGYSNRNGVVWNLLRDDLGTVPDMTPLNYENAFTRGFTPGDYTVNLHCYRCPQLPVPVDVEISASPVSADRKAPFHKIATVRVELRHAGQERTALRFTLDAQGNVDPESMNTVFKALRSGKK